MGLLVRLNPVRSGGQTGAMGRGSLRIYLGAAVGVGKTYAMLNEGRRRRARGTDVVVGFVETHGRAATAEQVGDLEVVPPVVGEPGSARLCGSGPEMDVDAVIARRPQVALVDDLAHANAPGARHPSRWQDVEDILDAGIDVVTTVNIGHLESMVDVAEAITGTVHPGTVPDEVVARAQQVELVDVTPEALRRRLAHGNIFPAGSLDPALTNYFRADHLAALRELTIQWLADQVDVVPGEPNQPGAGGWETRERIVVGITGAPGTDRLIRRAARIAHRVRGELVGVHIRPPAGSGRPGGDDPARPELERHRALLAELGGRYDEVSGSDVAEALIEFARSEHATQLVLGATDGSRWAASLREPLVHQVLRSAGPIDVHVISHDRSAGAEGTGRAPGRSAAAPVGAGERSGLAGRVLDTVRRRRSLLPSSRRRVAWLLVILGLPLLTAALAPLRGSVTLSSDLLAYLLLVVVVAATGGAAAALVAAVAATLIVNWFFTPPIHTWTVARGSDVVALTVYLGTAAIVSALVSVAAHRSAEASRANQEAQTLAAVAGGVVEADPLPELVSHLQQVFGLDGAALLRSVDGRWVVETGAGQAPLTPEAADEVHELGDDLVLALSGTGLGVQDRRVLNAFTAHLAAALDRRHLQARAAEASVLAEANQLRSSLLQAVSHDLRTPLASIKASVSSLRQGDISWTPAESSEFLATIEDETDRLSNLVSNLLDMSRVNANAVTAVLAPAALDAVVAGALAGLGARAKAVDVEVPENTPPVMADAPLLERVVANLVDNALNYAPDSPVRVDAGPVGDRVLLRVIDRGPGIPAAEKDRVFEAFQRLGDGSRPNRTGVGLGLAVARGFVRAMGAEISVEDTPGGGVTMVVALAAVGAGAAGAVAAGDGAPR